MAAGVAQKNRHDRGIYFMTPWQTVSTDRSSRTSPMLLSDHLITLAEQAERAGYTDTVTVMAGDDAEPGFDPEFVNTSDLMAGYARAVGGYTPALVDYGSADPGIWSEAQLLRVANGFAPNLAVPEIYSPGDASRWAALASYAKGVGQPLTFFGVLGGGTGGSAAPTGYSSFADALQPITGQDSFRWFSNISP